MDRVAMLQGHSHCHVTSFMNCRYITLVMVHHEALALGPHQNSISGIFNVFSPDRSGIVARCGNRCFIKQISKFSAGESGSSARNPVEIEFWLQLNTTGMHSKNRFPSSNIRQVDCDFTVETPRAC